MNKKSHAGVKWSLTLGAVLLLGLAANEGWQSVSPWPGDSKRTDEVSQSYERSHKTHTALLATGGTHRDPGSTVTISQSDETESATPKRQTAKISERLLSVLDSRPNEPVRVIVRVGRDSEATGMAALQSIEEWARQKNRPVFNGLAFMGATALSLSREEVFELANHEGTLRISLDEKVSGTLGITSAAVGANLVWRNYHDGQGFDGSGVSIAVIDSGVDTSHSDFLTASGRKLRVVSIDLVDDGGGGMDAFGHGTHVAGIAAGTGRRSYGESVPSIGIAPRAGIINFRVLDKEGAGYASDVIEALGLAIQKKNSYNIRVINLSLGHPVYEPYIDDPMCIATALAVQNGIAVVASAGNNGRSDGKVLFGGINSPGNAPWVITVGAVATNETVSRSDDRVADYSSRGPTVYDGLLKPDLVAPGDAIVSCQAPNSTLAVNHPELQHVLSNGDDSSYFVLHGTSMATPVVSGTLALMFQANPSLGPNAAKAILMYTAQKMKKPDMLAQGNGMLNSEGAVRLALAIRSDSNEVPEMGFWLDAASKALSVGLIEPYSSIAGERVYFGSAMTTGNGVLWSNEHMWSSGKVWGSGTVWEDGIIWSNGYPWFDNLMAFRFPAYGDGILWSNSLTQAIIWHDGVLWTNDLLDGLGILWSHGVLWSNSFILDLWNPLLIDPISIGIDIGVLTEGEAYRVRGYAYGDGNADYYPQEPPPE